MVLEWVLVENVVYFFFGQELSLVEVREVEVELSIIVVKSYILIKHTVLHFEVLPRLFLLLFIMTQGLQLQLS